MSAGDPDDVLEEEDTERDVGEKVEMDGDADAKGGDDETWLVRIGCLVLREGISEGSSIDDPSCYTDNSGVRVRLIEKTSRIVSRDKQQ